MKKKINKINTKKKKNRGEIDLLGVTNDCILMRIFSVPPTKIGSIIALFDK